MRNYMAAGWFYSPSQIVRYFATRISSLKPRRGGQGPRHPIAVLRQLDRHQWLMFLAGFLGWTWDSFDFFTVSLCVTEIAAEFKVEPSSVTWGITVTLMLRSVGALIFGTLADRYGRKWPMITCLVLFIVLELATGFTHNLRQFLGVRALYGIAMGGLFGPAAATALEDLPWDARGLLSGLFEQGYAMGYLFSALFYRALVPTTSHGWRSLFWFGAGPPVLIIAYRLCLPETNYFLVMKAERDAEHAALKAGHQTQSKTNELRAFVTKAGQAIRGNWVLLIYMVVLMSGFNSVSHGSQDLYPTFLKDQLGMNATNTTIITVIGQIGALIGGATIGYISTIIGRRLTMMTACVIGGALVPAYIFTRSLRIIAPVFFEQFFVGGVWGPIPIHLIELSPPVLRTLTVGLTYQLGNLVSAASATIEATIGQRYPLPPLPNGTSRYDYGRVIGIFLGSVWAYMLFFLFLGPEMTPEERAEMAEEAKEFENLRRIGTNFQEVGERRAREKLVGRDEMIEDVERPRSNEKDDQDIEHKESA